MKGRPPDRQTATQNHQQPGYILPDLPPAQCSIHLHPTAFLMSSEIKSGEWQSSFARVNSQVLVSFKRYWLPVPASWQKQGNYKKIRKPEDLESKGGQQGGEPVRASKGRSRYSITLRTFANFTLLPLCSKPGTRQDERKQPNAAPGEV